MSDKGREQRRMQRVHADPEKREAYLTRKRNEARLRGPLDPAYERERKKAWRERNAERNRAHRLAHHAVESALRTGKLVRPMECSDCGAVGEIEAHHWSYEPEHRLDVH